MLALAALGVGAAAALRGPAVRRPEVESAGHRELRDLLGRLAAADLIPEDSIDFFLATARRESDFSNRARNTSDSEAQAARTLLRGALERGWYAENPTIATDRAAWEFGSGGWFGFLPATGMTAGGHHGPFSRQHPALIFDPVASVLMAVDFADGITRGQRFAALPTSEQNYLALSRAWKSPRLVSDWLEDSEYAKANHRRLIKHLVALGLPEEAAERYARRRAEFPRWDLGDAMEVLG